MKFPEISGSLAELETIKGKWSIALCGAGPLVRAVKAQGGRADPALAKMGQVLVVDAGDDAATLSKLAGLLEGVAPKAKLPVTLVVRVEDRNLMRAADQRLFEDGITPRPVIVSSADLIAERSLLEHRLFELARWRNQDRLNIKVLGFGALGRSFLDEIILNGVASGLKLPAIEIITADVARAEAILRRDIPEYALAAEIKITALDLEALGDPRRGPFATSAAQNPLTAIFVLFDDADETLRATAEICALQKLHGLAHAALFVGGAGAAMAARLMVPVRTGRNLALGVHELSNLNSIPDLLTHILIKRDLVARRIHAAYESLYKGKTEAGTSWDALPETYRRANRRAASHLVQKLSALGLETDGGSKDFASVSPQAFARVITPLAKSNVEDDVMRGLARLEHERWCADRRLDGWSYGEVRDDGRRLHPSLVAFDDPRLTTAEIEKDVSQLRFLLGHVVESKADGATACIQAGIVDGAGQAGISPEAVQERFALEPERSIILISPLLSEEELNITSALMGHLAASGRKTRLVIPEWFAGNATLRDEKIARSEKLLGLIADKRVVIAPIGPQQFSASEDWAEVGLIDEQRASLVSYVTARADVLISVQNPDQPA
ncbi:RyR domain-containing protein [Aestuariivirga litoralis]|uniref:RyR domain-containing protein n=1 Tax=Aestuariivirga litoralis TaxID=2650924 RepID=UPI0018C46B07|nr:RyR domain-containing protein [Aestuariivirga litoralis]MBG1233902.1 hypothetical protein [Aestuariivirga litoralis]